MYTGTHNYNHVNVIANYMEAKTSQMYANVTKLVASSPGSYWKGKGLVHTSLHMCQNISQDFQ